MSARFSFFEICCYLFLLVVVSFFHSCFSNQKFDNEVLCIGGERKALVHFKHGLIDETDRLASWDADDERDCCRWAGITCDNSTGHIRSIHLRALDGHCDESEYMTYLEYKEATKQMLRGKLSPSLLHLKRLTHLDLSCNDFEGIQVPKFIGSLTNLRYLNLSRSHFGGIIPPQLGNLSDLQVLCLGSFHWPYEGTSMKNMQWMSSLRWLYHLDMSGVELYEANDWLQAINTLPSLVQLHLSSCYLRDIHPHIFSLNLTSLSVLNLSSNDFDSSVPPWIFSITSMVSLDLNDCSFRGFIPRSMYSFRNLTSLEMLYVARNSFMNSSLVLNGLSSIGGNLISLDLSDCGISSSGLDSLNNLTSLITLDLSSNQLTNELPKLLGCNLRDLDLSENNFSNISLTSLVESVFKCKSPHLESLSLSYSGLSGTIPDSIGRLSFLRSLDLSNNLISGPIPSSIGQLPLLKKLRLSSNQLNGGLPYSIGRLSSLEVLDLSYNQLNGSLPNSLGQLSKLAELIFSSNLMSGIVTEAHFSNLVSLKSLEGEGNKLTLRPQFANWIPPFRLWRLNLNSWCLGPQFPLWLQSQKDLWLLYISNTGISSSMPPVSFWRLLPKLTEIDMSQNRIKGTLNLLDFPATLTLLDLSTNELIGELTPISNFSIPIFLGLSNNMLGGSLHDFLCSNGVKETFCLYLGNNYFSGIIPECWETWPNLKYLELENNSFSGGIPATLGFLSELRILNMRGNNLSGKVPASFVNLTSLVILILGQNELVGSIPTWFGTKIPYLSILNLRSNNFDGKIPHELCYLKEIQILDLAHNNLSGNIPKCFNNFSVLTGDKTISQNEIIFIGPFAKYVMASDSLVMKGREDTYNTILGLVTLLDLSCNNLVGHIPDELMSLKALQTLNLSRNRLTGRIPRKIGDMMKLISFDLSVNMLSGELPVSLSSLNFLSSFNVSYNNLTGRVPSSTQLQTLNESSFFGNKLCGHPLIELCIPVEVHMKGDSDQQENDGADWGLIVSIVLGIVSGFWIVLAPLIVSTSWRIAYFRFLSKLRW